MVLGKKFLIVVKQTLHLALPPTNHLKISYLLLPNKIYPSLLQLEKFSPTPCHRMTKYLFRTVFSDTHSQVHHPHSMHIMNQAESLAATIALLKAIKTPNKVKATLPQDYSATSVLAATLLSQNPGCSTPTKTSTFSQKLPSQRTARFYLIMS